MAASPFAGTALAAWVVPEPSVPESSASAAFPADSIQDPTSTATAPVSGVTLARAEVSDQEAAQRAQALLMQAQDEVVRLTGVLNEARRERARAPEEARPVWDAAIAALSDARARRAMIVRDLIDGQAVMDGAKVTVLERDALAAMATTRKGQDLLIAAQGRGVAPPPTAMSAPQQSMVEAVRRPEMPVPALPSVPASLPNPARPPAPAAAPVFLPDPERPPALAVVPAPEPEPEPEPEPARPPVLAAVPAPLPDPERPPAPASASAPVSASAPASAALNRLLNALDPLPPRPQVLVAADEPVDTLGRTLPSPPPVEITGVAALPIPGAAEGPFRRGGPADWEPSAVLVAPPRDTVRVSVNPNFAGRAAGGTAVPQPFGPALALGSPAPAQAPPQGAEVVAAAGAGAGVATPARPMTPPSAPPSMVRPDPVPAVASPATPPPRPSVTDPAPATEAPRAAGVRPFDVAPQGGAGGALDSGSQAEFARIARTVAAQHQKARNILDQIGPVRADLLKRIKALPAGDGRRAGLEEVRGLIDGAETKLTAAVQQYQALSRQLEVVLDGTTPASTAWTPRDAVRQAIAASADADQGVGGLRRAMTQFEDVLTGRP